MIKILFFAVFVHQAFLAHNNEWKYDNGGGKRKRM